MHVGIVGQRDNARAGGLAEEIATTLTDEGIEVDVDETTAAAIDREGVPTEAMAETDLVVSIGGDGTFLYAARGARDTPLLGVNLGEVGFLNAVKPEEAVDQVCRAVELAREGDLPLRTVPRLQVTGEDWSLPQAVNEVVVQGAQRGHGNGLDLEVRVDGSLYTGTHADGVMVTTPTGSTAYNLSEGGPLVHPSVSGLVITEMCASNPMPSLVVDEAASITIRVDGAPKAFVVSDGRSEREISPPARVSVTAGGEPVRLAGPSVDFFSALRKLS